MERSKGKRIPSGGTLVIGREQDCLGGCFESDAGASGNIVEFGWRRQDFFGLIDELRIWRAVRTREEIVQVRVIHVSDLTFQPMEAMLDVLKSLPREAQA